MKKPLASYHSKMNYSYEVVNFSIGDGMRSSTGSKQLAGVDRGGKGIPKFLPLKGTVIKIWTFRTQ